MKLTPWLLALALYTTSFASQAEAQKTKKKKAAPKNEITKLKKARKTDHTVRQVTPDPKKSPGKHADNLSKNANHGINRISKDINHALTPRKNKKKP